MVGFSQPFPNNSPECLRQTALQIGAVQLESYFLMKLYCTRAPYRHTGHGGSRSYPNWIVPDRPNGIGFGALPPSSFSSLEMIANGIYVRTSVPPSLASSFGLQPRCCLSYFNPRVHCCGGGEGDAYEIQ